MVTNLVTVREDDLIDFAESLMDWNQYDHLPVEGMRGAITGLISKEGIGAFRETSNANVDALVSECMNSDIVTVAPETSIEKAAKIMEVNDFGSMPVVRDDRAIGLVTLTDIKKLRVRTGAAPS